MLSLFSRRPTFRHGIHPPESKDATSGLPIRQFPFAPVLVIPLQQHIGRPAVPLVREGQEVVRGQRIARADGFVSVALHAPASGVIERIDLVPSQSGKRVPGVFLRPFPSSTQEVVEGEPVHPDAEPDAIVAAIQEAGIVGLGGAAFPTHVKLKVPEGKNVDALIVNGVECEPWLTTDHRVMLEQAADVFMGIRYLRRVAAPARVIVAIEANKLDAAEHLRVSRPPDLADVEIAVLPVKYPQGAEKMLITALLGREVPSGGLPLDVGALCVNVATTAEIGRLLPHGRGIQERVITISGPAIRRQGNYRIPIGTPLRFLLETVGVEDDLSRVFLGGPMMGPSASTLDVSIVKGTSGVVAFTERETGRLHAQPEYPCIRCADCVEACPLGLDPSGLGLLAKRGEHQRMADELHLMDCFECGACSYVCPAHIPLVQRFRVAKAAVRRAASTAQAEAAREGEPRRAEGAAA